MVKMTKCRQCVHPREGVADTPSTPQQAAPGVDSSSAQRGSRIDLFPDILNEAVYP